MSPSALPNRLSGILKTAQVVISQLDLDKALSIALRKALEITGTKAGSIALHHVDTNTMRIHAYRGFSKGFIANREWKIRRGGLTHRILRTKGITVITDTTNKSFFTNPLAVGEGIKSLVCVPLVHRQEVVGILYVDDFTPRKFSRSSLAELEILASFASIAIHHARTYSIAKQQATTDSLTGLFNRRSFEELLGRELQRAERNSRDLSLALIDVDDFKKFNDLHGHQAGDQALAGLGVAIRKAVRSTDLACRYGGDEMVIILPETKLKKACEIFEQRVRVEIEQELARISAGKVRLSVTIGIASFPQDGKTAHDLVLAADRALLDAKKNKHSRIIGCSRPIELPPA